jgi:hemerythrin superfamily protein
MDPVQMIKDDHNQVKALFHAFGQASEHRTKERIAKQVILELEIHATVEEELLYPQIRKLEGTADLISRAEQEHHAADAIMLSLSDLPRGDRNYDARFQDLTHTVEQHIEKEEAEILPKAAVLDDSVLREVGDRMERRKRELLGKVPYPLTGRRTRQAPSRAAGRSSRGTGQAHAS